MSLVNNSIGWANFQISGGPARALWVAMAVALFVPLIIFGFTFTDEERPERVLEFFYYAIGVLNIGILTLGLPGRVHGAMRRDRTTTLIESHRLMPTPASHAIFGYLIGPNIVLVAVVLVLFVIGIVLGQLTTQNPAGWVALHVGGCVLAISLSCFVAFTSQWIPKVNPALLLMVFGPLLSVGAFTVVPALQVMFGPLLDGLPMLRAPGMGPAVIVGAVAQMAFAGIFFVGACRRYRRDDVPALGFWWGFLLLALWVLLTMYGIVGSGGATPFGRSGRSEVASYLVSVTLSMLLAIGPVASAAQAGLAWRTRKAFDAHFADRRPIPVALATMLVLSLLWVLLWAAPQTYMTTVLLAPNTPEFEALRAQYSYMATDARGWAIQQVPQATTWQDRATVVGIVSTFVVTVGLLAWAAGRVRVPAAGVLTFWVLVTWALPPVVDGARLMLTGDETAAYPGPIGAASPPFGLGAIFSGDLRSAIAGLIAQVAMIPLLVGAWLFVRRTRPTAAPLPSAIANA